MKNPYRIDSGPAGYRKDVKNARKRLSELLSNYFRLTEKGWTWGSGWEIPHTVSASLSEKLNAYVAGTSRESAVELQRLARREAVLGNPKRRVRGNPRREGKKKEGKKGKRKAMQIQSLLFPLSSWSPERARAWARKFHHKPAHLTEEDGYYRIPQHAPSDYQRGTLHRVTLAKNVEAMVGIPLSASDAGSTPGYNSRGPRQQYLPFPASPPSQPSYNDDVLW